MYYCGEPGLDLFHRVIVHGGSALNPATFVRQRRSYVQSLAARLNCSVDAAAAAAGGRTPPSQRPSRAGRLVDCLKQSPVADLVSAGAAVSADAPRFVAAFGPSVDGRTVLQGGGTVLHGGGTDLRARMSSVDSRQRVEFSNVSLLTGLSVGDALSLLTPSEIDASSGDNVAQLNRKRRTLVRTFVQNLFTFHRQTIADIFLHQV